MPTDYSTQAGGEEEIFAFQFEGHADIDSSEEYTGDYDGGRLATLLNKDHSRIIDEITGSIETSLHQPGILVNVKIEFLDGSIEWIGVVTLFVAGANLLSSISGTVDFFDKATKLIEFAIGRSVRESVLQEGVRIQPGSFRVNVIQPILVTPYQRSQASLLENLNNWHKEQIRFTQLVIQNQNVILDGFVKAENEKQKLRLYIIGLLVVLFIIILYLLFR